MRFSTSKKSFSNVLLLLLVLLVLFSPNYIIVTNAFSLGLLPIISKVVLPYSLYSIAVDKYAQHVVDQMKTIPPIIMIDDNNDENEDDGDDVRTSLKNNKKVKLPSELRKTINKWNGIVTNVNDRKDWNEFITTTSSKKKMISQSSSDRGTTVNAAASLLLLAKDLCGKYQFAYRSYVNFEEHGAICCYPFYNWKQFLIVFRSKGLLTIQPKVKVDEDKQKGGETKRSVENIIENLEVTNVEEIRFGFILPITAKWYGKIVVNDDDKFEIVWTKTEMKVGFLKKIDNPKVSVELSSQPWEILKLDDGMICFQRGDIGYLAYDRNSML